ncbi:hypothetical protein M446_6741 [Methylobacterium sp. 4-46]|nr:hypothetical protein M446_6741 [Methylobacterium sp. 4-46]
MPTGYHCELHDLLRQAWLRKAAEQERRAEELRSVAARFRELGLVQNAEEFEAAVRQAESETLAWLTRASNPATT